MSLGLGPCKGPPDVLPAYIVHARLRQIFQGLANRGARVLAKRESKNQNWLSLQSKSHFPRHLHSNAHFEALSQILPKI